MKRFVFLFLFTILFDLFSQAGGNALSFNGVDQYLDLGNNFKYTDNVTIELWAYRDSWNLTPDSLKSETLISCMEEGGWRIELQNYASGDSIEMQAYCSGLYYKAAVSTEGLYPGWVYIKGIFVNNQYLRIYISNTQGYKNINGTTISYDPDNYTIIGADASGGSVPYSRFWNGKIDEIKILNTSAIPSYNYLPLTGTEWWIDDLRGYYTFDELGTDNQYDDLTNNITPNSETEDATPHNSPDEVVSDAPMGDIPINFINGVMGIYCNSIDEYFHEGMGIEYISIPPAGDFVVAGTNNVNGNTRDDIPAGVDKRVERTWYVDDNSDFSARFSFDLDQIEDNGLDVSGLYLAANDFKLLYRPDLVSPFTIETSATGWGSSTYYMPLVSAKDGYYSLGVSYGSPTIQARDIVIEEVYSDSVKISWTGGNGDFSHNVFVKEGNSGQAMPEHFTNYSYDTEFWQGTQIGTTGWYCVYGEMDNSCTITGLQPNTEYIISICEYDWTEAGMVYNIQTAPDNPRTFITRSISTPVNVTADISEPNFILSWDAVAGATSYKIYSSNDPYGTFTEDTGGTLVGETWTIPYTESKKFYYVVAVDAKLPVTKKKAIKTTNSIR